MSVCAPVTPCLIAWRQGLTLSLEFTVAARLAGQEAGVKGTWIFPMATRDLHSGSRSCTWNANSLRGIAPVQSSLVPCSLLS